MLRRTRISACDGRQDPEEREVHMVEIIGLVTMGALIWLLSWSMAGESESEKRRISGVRDTSPSSQAIQNGTRTKQAA
jgi:hypothetical protein